MKTRKMLLVATASLVLFALGCSSMTIRYKDKGDGPVVEEGKKDKGGPPAHAHGLLKIPRGHLPKPGMCRIWVPGTPPGHQRKAGNCSTLASQVPAGAWLVYRHADNPDRVDITVYDEKRAGLIIEVRIFDMVTGEFLRHDEHSARK